MARYMCTICLGTGILPFSKDVIPCLECEGEGYIFVDTESEEGENT